MKSTRISPQLKKPLTSQEKKTIDRAVKKVVKEYHTTLTALAKT